MGYDNVAIVPKYFLTIEGEKQNFEDYYYNRHLFVITPRENFYENAPYEVATFRPAAILKKWTLNKTYTMYLLSRTADDSAIKDKKMSQD